VSGGGGWGSKQGLLSLDPQTSCIDDTDEAPFDFSSGSLEEQHASALGNMAQPGAYIQFFVADSSQIECGDHLHGPAKRHLKAAEMFQNSLVIGTVPSTIDDLPQPQKNNGQEASGIRGSHIKIRLGHFGCVSESGMFLSHTEVEPSHSDDQIELTNRQTSTKVDLPYSYFYRNTWKRTDKTKRPASMTPDDQPVHGPPAIEQEP
jgi:hypothetical protein